MVESKNVAGPQRKVLSMDVDPSNKDESLYRIQLGDRVKYFVLDPGTFDSDIITFPPALLEHLPELPHDEWTQARIFRQNNDICVETFSRPLSGISTNWHQNFVDVLALEKMETLGPTVQLVKWQSKYVIAKFARFEFEIPALERETAVYQTLEGHDIGPAFLGHLTEHDRVIGFLLEYVDGRHADVEDLQACQSIVKRLHALNIVHGDLNRYNFLITPAGAKLLDFEVSIVCGRKEAMDEEYDSIVDELQSESGVGGSSELSPVE